MPESTNRPADDNSTPTTADAAAETGHHSGAGGARYVNRLAHETSPYLLQHAHNPVDWYPWGEEAFEKARREEKPLFVSIGYSTCYWCHVMERESFEDEETARIMNERFVCIKVDREERPDVDEVCMTACMLTTGSGGWPLNLALTPPPPLASSAPNAGADGGGFIDPAGVADDGGTPTLEGEPGAVWRGLEPFWAGTYFPREPAFGRPSFIQVMDQLHYAWTKERDSTLRQASQMARSITQRLSEHHSPTPVGAEEIGQAAAYLLRLHDGEEGGFGNAPKFPQPVFCQFLMTVRDAVSEEARRDQIDSALSVTLDRMAMGGMYDQIGGGFHRYSTDAQWLVPHFEKMLYDNGQLASLYASAARAAGGDSFYSEIATEICDYVLREMTDPETGAFFSAQDAEVNHREGLNYLWTREQVADALAADGADPTLIDFALDGYGLNAGPNFQDPHHPEDEMKNVIFLARHPGRLSEEMNLPRNEVDQRLRRVNEILLKVRDTREQPGLDDKVIIGWNGLMISGMADVGSTLNRPGYIEAGRRAWQFINSSMRDDTTGDLLRIYRAGQAKVPAFAEDYAFLTSGLISLYRATGDPSLLQSAAHLMHDARDRFWDPERGGYFDTRPGQSEMFVRSRSVTDGAVPAANSVMLHNLIDLYRLTEERNWGEDAAAVLSSISAAMHRNAIATINSTRALLIIISTMPEVLEMSGSIPGSKGPGFKPGSEGHQQRVAPTVHDDTQGVLREPDEWADDVTETATAGTAANPVDDANLDGLTMNEASSARAVTVRASTKTLKLEGADSEPKSLIITLDIAPGFHVNAHEPGIEQFVGATIEVRGRHAAEALVLEIDWPEGEPYRMGPPDADQADASDQTPETRVYGGPTAIPVRVGWSSEITGERARDLQQQWSTTSEADDLPHLAVRFQACRQFECLAPAVIRVPVTIETGGAAGQ
ncbi:MAG: thioredoxin domain-containing protein [Planctomycetota bacterium]